MDQIISDTGRKQPGLLGDLDVNSAAEEDHAEFMKRIEEKKTEEYIEAKVAAGELPKSSLLLPMECLPLTDADWAQIK